MSTIAAVAPLLPSWVYPQAEITAELAPLIDGDERAAALMSRLHASSGIDTRHLALPLGSYRSLGSFTQANDAFIELGVDLGERALKSALSTAGIAPGEVDFLLYTSVTGISAPSLDALVAPRVGLRHDVKRIPSFGLGCVAGAAGLARVHDYLLGHPDDVAVLLSVELCSLTFQRDDDSVAGLVACGLFGDGATAVVLLGERRARRWRAEHPEQGAAPRVVDSASLLYPGTEDELGWHVGATGFRIVLSSRLPEIIQAHLADDVAAFLAPHGLGADDVGTWVAHAGGPKILEAMSRSLGLPDGALDLSWRCLARAGNLSSSSVLHVLGDTIAQPRRAGGDGVLLAFGPGLCAELVLLRWPGPAVSAGPSGAPPLA